MENWIGPINEMWVSQRYNILGQVEMLKTYSKVKLIMVGKTVGMSMSSSGCKEVKIIKLVENHILTQVVAQAGNMSLEERALINDSYNTLLETRLFGSQSMSQILINALEQYYIAWLGRNRMGMSMSDLMYLVENPNRAIEPVARAVAIINVNQSMQEVAECGICYESKSRIRFNCLHEFCKDCVHAMCEHSAIEIQIKCPMCRVNVSTFEVEDEATKQSLLIVA